MANPAINKIKTAEPTLMEVPFADNVENIDLLRCGLHQSMFSISYEGDSNHGEVHTGAGCGNDYIQLRWGKRRAVVTGRDLLAAWIRGFDPEQADELAEFFGGDDTDEELNPKENPDG